MPTGMTRSGHVAAQRRLRRDDAPSARGATSITFCLRVYGSVLLGFFFVVKAWSYGAHWVKIESVERWGIVPVGVASASGGRTTFAGRVRVTRETDCVAGVGGRT